MNNKILCIMLLSCTITQTMIRRIPPQISQFISLPLNSVIEDAKRKIHRSGYKTKYQSTEYNNTLLYCTLSLFTGYTLGNNINNI